MLMGEALLDYLIRVIRQEGRRRSIGDRLVLAGLTVLSWVYRGGVALRNKLYDLGISRTVQLPCVVVSVGNITTGGTGKTPIVEYLARLLQSQGWRVSILSRGYRSALTEKRAVGIVSDTGGVKLTAQQAGDEAYLLAKNLPQVPVVIGKDRSLAGKVACKRFGCDVAILDDGFQHRRLHRDIDVVAVDATNPFGNGHLLPRGFLRESLRELRRADVIVLTRTDQVPNEKLVELRRQLRRWNQTAPIYLTIHSPAAWERLTSVGSNVGAQKTKGLFSLNKLVSSKVIAVSGIGNPDSFAKTLTDIGVQVAGHLRFADHHDYEPADVEKIIHFAHARQVKTVVITEKDAVKFAANGLESLQNAGLELYVLRIALEPTDRAAFDRFFLDRVTSSEKVPSTKAGY